MTTHDTVTVAGAGTMGPGIAQTFAARDYRVTLADISDDALTTARQTIEANLAQETRLGLISEDNAARIVGRIGFTSDIPKAIAASDIIVEAVSEKPAVKTGFFATVAAGTYALTSLAAIVFSRAVLGLFIDFNRPVTFFRVLGSITDPFMALFDPVTPGFIEPALKPFYTAFCLYFIKMMLFGVGAAPPPWVFLLLALG